MKEVAIKAILDETVEILLPNGSGDGSRCTGNCLCCQRADQPMDEDGCGICDICLGLPVLTTDNEDGLEFPMPGAHLSLTARNR